MGKSEPMESEFIGAAMVPHTRASLLTLLNSDPALRAKAVARRDYLAEAHRAGQIFDRDHVSKVVHDMLERMLAQVAAAKQAAPEVKVE